MSNVPQPDQPEDDQQPEPDDPDQDQMIAGDDNLTDPKQGGSGAGR